MAAAAAAAPAESGGGPPDFGLPEEVLAVLPSDPFEQLDVARKITSIALAGRVSRLESEAARLRQRLAEKDDLVADLRAQLETLDASLADLSHQLDQAQEEKETLLSENASLSNTVKKLNRDISKLEGFKKTLMQSLKEEEENPQVGAPRVKVSDTASFSTVSSAGESDAGLPTSRTSSTPNQLSESGSPTSEDSVAYVETDGSKQSRAHVLSTSLGGTPRLTPPDSPPRRHSISFATTRNMFDERSSIFSSLPTSHHSSMTSPFDMGSQTGRTRVDGKEFFRQVRSRLSYEHFSAFLSNVKELNAHKQTREETLRKAEEIFGPDNKDLYTIFEGLITRNLH
ncbi:uncharacterized protein At4g15545 isoform X1 [Ananas comosus]|uniref:Uncharacterized protein At4g15545 isoform X1 n=1 Tax=Ananas comosus TaxID=4615 RepID=A0A6P5EQX3_ANACO|nr:uncharacterized protein At4g15545 isoform X1 [Ananas comosus]